MHGSRLCRTLVLQWAAKYADKHVAANATTDHIVTLDLGAEQELVAQFRDGKQRENEHQVP